jgi:hypothetical protein
MAKMLVPESCIDMFTDEDRSFGRRREKEKEVRISLK